jgi:nitric oxide dioxygenase
LAPSLRIQFYTLTCRIPAPIFGPSLNSVHGHSLKNAANIGWKSSQDFAITQEEIMLQQQTIEIVKATAPVVELHAEAITRRFYQLMFAGNPEVQVYFNPAHQHSGGQQRALAAAICAYAANIDNLPALGPAVELIGQKHCSLGIQPEHYPIVGKHLLVAIKDILKEAATDDIMAAWAEAYGFLANVCIEREAAIYKGQAAMEGGWNGYRRVVVERKVAENDIISSFYLRASDGRPLPQFLPGQYITVRINHPETPTSPRNYSLSDRPGLPHYRISVKREPAFTSNSPVGVVSNYLHDHVEEGDALEIGPPCGEFTLQPAQVRNKTIVLLAGGIGVTPVLSMLKALAHAEVTMPVYFVHAARNSRVHAFASEVREIADRHPLICTHFLYDSPLPGDLRMGRCDSCGIVDLALLRKLLPSNDADFYFCGPKPFMVGLYSALKSWGVHDNSLHFEFFGPRQDITVSSSQTYVHPFEKAG